VVLEGQEGGEVGHELMGIYERVEDKEMNGRGVWQAVNGVDGFLYYFSSEKQWCVSNRESMEAGNGEGFMGVRSIANTPDRITEQWEVDNGKAWATAPKLRVRVCSTVDKQRAEKRVAQDQEQALEQAQESRQLVVEGLGNDPYRMMGLYELIENPLYEHNVRLVNRRAVWQRQNHGGDEERFLYYSVAVSYWVVSNREHTDAGSPTGFMTLTSAALTPDQNCPSEVWEVNDGTKWIAIPEVRVRRQEQSSSVAETPAAVAAGAGSAVAT
jgi:hypothetical protein